ncbi:MAG TPA: redoxin family protein [Myxococcota bacterium]|nr:redoxin family protein [Myxococcota bacterium]
MFQPLKSVALLGTVSLLLACDGSAEVSPSDTTADAAPDLSDTAAPDAPESDISEPDAPEPDSTSDVTLLDLSPETTACPPSGPTGTTLGQVLADTTLVACDGTPVSLHSFCGRPLYINTFAGWCPPCRADAEDAEAAYAALPGDAQWLFVIAENNSGTAPTTAYCEAIRETYGLTMSVVIDTSGSFPGHLGVGSPSSWHAVLDRAFTLVYRAKYDQAGAIEALETLAP